MASMIPGAIASSAPLHRSARSGILFRTLNFFCFLLATSSALCAPHAWGQTITWDLIADWNGRNPIDNYWSLSGPTGAAAQYGGLQVFGGNFGSPGACFGDWIGCCPTAPHTHTCSGSPPVTYTIPAGHVFWHGYASIQWTSSRFRGSVHLDANFSQVLTGQPMVFIKKNGTLLWQRQVVGSNNRYTGTFEVVQDDQFTFELASVTDGIVDTTIVINGTPCEVPTSAWSGAAGNGEWDSAGNWSPSGRPTDNAGAVFNLAAPTTVRVPAGRMVGAIGAYSGLLNLIVSDGTLSSPTDQCVPIGGSLLIGDTSMTAGFSLFGNMLCDRVVAVGFGTNSQATLAVDTFGTLRTQSGLVVAYASGSTGIVNVDGHGQLLQTSGPSISLARGDDSFGTINLTNGGTLQYSAATPLKVGNGPGAQGTINLTGSFEGVSSLTPSGSSSQILLGAQSPPPGGTTTLGTINLHDRGLVRATEIRLGAEPRTRGTITMDGGTLDVESLVIADKGDGSLDWSGGTITGLRQITIGNGTGNSGRLDLDGPGRSLTLATPLGGETQNLYAGKTGRGRIFVTNGASIDLSSSSLGGLSIGATDPAGAGGVQIVGHEPGNPLFRSRIVGSAGSVLNVGRTYTVPLTIPALLIDDGARATFGSVHVGRENWMDGEVHVKNRAILQQIRPGADAFASNDGLEIRGTPTGARLLVDSGGQVQCTSGIAFNTYLGDPVIKLTGTGSTLDCSGRFYVAGDPPAGGKMLIEAGARMTSRDVSIAVGGGGGLSGELTLSGPGEVLNVSGTLTVGVDGDPAAAGRLILQNSAKVRTHRLALGDNYFINSTSGPPAILVGGTPLLAPDIQCDTLMSSGTFNPPGLDISFGVTAGIGGHGTWAGSFDSLGEIVVPDAVIANGNSPMPRLTIDGNLVQHPSSVLEVAATCAVWAVGEAIGPIGSLLSVTGNAHLAGTLRLTEWTIGMSEEYSSLQPPWIVGRTLPVLSAASVSGTFNAVEFGPGFPTNRVQLTYEPTQVLVTFLPPVCDTTIQTQPTSQTACTDGAVAFTVAATAPDAFGLPTGYQWQEFRHSDGLVWGPINDGFNGDQLGSHYTAEGATTPNLTLTIDPAFFYEDDNPNIPIRCVLTNACGEQIISDAAILTVHSPPQFSMQPENALACTSNDVFLTVTASEGVAYQWRKGGLPIDTAANPTAATATLSLTNVQFSDADVYDCTITNPCASVTSDPATLTICIGDFNCDGGIDGSDVSAFFGDWEAGNAAADLNQDGGVDGADVGAFFERWEAGC